MSTWYEDAREFGRFVRQGGWRLGLLVARHCGEGMGKVSVSQFAIEARIGTTTVANHLRAWELAAEENLVPPARALTSNSEPDITSANLPEWRQFYRSDRQLQGRSGSVELHPDPDVMKRRLERRPDRAEIAKAVAEALPPGEKAAHAEEISHQVETEHVPAPLPPRERPTYIVVDSVQHVIDDLERVVLDAERLPPVMTSHSKLLLADAARLAMPTVMRLIDLGDGAARDDSDSEVTVLAERSRA